MTSWKNKYEKLCGWVYTQGFKVVEGHKEIDRLEFSNKTIYLNSQFKYENRLYILLHECGHLKTDKNIKTFLKYHPMYPTEVHDGRKLESKAYKVCLVSEELKAWQNGLKLANYLKIEINKTNYDKLMVNSVYTYIQWANYA